MTDRGLVGVIISDHVAGRTYDEPDFLPFFTAAEELGAIVFFHQGGDTVVNHRIRRYKLGNAVGNLTERASSSRHSSSAAFSTGAPTSSPTWPMAVAALGVARMDKVAGALEPDTGKGFIPIRSRRPGSRRPCPERLSRAVHL